MKISRLAFGLNLDVNDLLFTKIYTRAMYTSEQTLEHDKGKHDKVYHLFIIIPVSSEIIFFRLLGHLSC